MDINTIYAQIGVSDGVLHFGQEVLSGLTEQESKVVTMRFGLEDGKPLSAQEVGVKLGLTADQVVALESAALIKMRKEEENS